MKTKLAQTLNGGGLALTAECVPPHGADGAAVRQMAASLPNRLDAVVVAESGLACAAILARENVQPVLSLITRDRNRMALQADVLGAASLGIESVLCLSGDHQCLGMMAQPQAAGAYDIDSIQLVQGVRTMCTKGVDFAGRKLDAAPQMLIGAAAHPYQRPMELNLMRLKKKVRAGTDYFITQAVFDLAGFVEWMDGVRAAGIDKKAFIIASVLPLTSVEQAERLAKERTYAPLGPEIIDRLAKASDRVREGVAIAVEMARKLKDIPGVRGIHIFSGGAGSVATIIEEAGLQRA